MISIKKIQENLLNLLWSLWTELGVRGHHQKHTQTLISLEELVLLTAVLAETDPRLRDETLDWLALYHRFISISRLKTLLKEFDTPIQQSFSQYASTLNSISSAHWPVPFNSPALIIKLSHKSSLRPLESPALLNIRARSFFGTGARADVITFFLTHREIDFPIADTVEIGYSKRNLAEILDEFWLSGLLEKSSLRNQNRYRLTKREQLQKVIGPLPKYTPPWHELTRILIPILGYLQRIQYVSETTQAVEIRNLLIGRTESLTKLRLSAPPFDGDVPKYLKAFDKWLVDVTSKMAQGDFS